MMKPTGGHELHYGRSSNAHDVAAFARAAQGHSMRVLSADEFEQLIISPSTAPDGVTVRCAQYLSRSQAYAQMWLVDFFAPWCPPCQKLLPEVRKASRALANDPHVRVATVDCTVQMQVCQRAQVESKDL